MAKFKVKARTVDLLGRQQIAGIPTAISELLKNAHDAYSNVGDIDYFRDDRLFVLRDDGLGMTREDFEQRWLTIGTESKLDTDRGIEKPAIDRDQKKRPILGEKGIGRLAIAIIGPQVLVISRARDRNGNGQSKAVVAYIHWGLFELPGVDLDTIEIPIRELSGGKLPSSLLIQEMLEEVSSSLDNLDPALTPAEIKKFRKDFGEFTVDPESYAGVLGEPTLAGDGHGTHFYIMPAAEILDEELDYRETDNSSTNIEKNLIGFTNTMIKEAKRPPIITHFRDYIDESEPIERIGEKAFFTPHEFEMADHHINGRFDEFGKFVGSVGIYQMNPDPYEVDWIESQGKKTSCGPFEMSFAYIQGVASESLLPADEHSRMKRKLDRFGGLYLYRDGIRVLPYGDSDYDFLHIEKRRTLSAGYYFYSYRRMFGVINLSREKNHLLTEKAGREGFQENKAYKQFRSILQNFFTQSAGDFFRESVKGGGIRSEKWISTRDDLTRREKIRRKADKKATQKKKIFQKNLDIFFKNFNEKTYDHEMENVERSLNLDISKILKLKAPPTVKAVKLVDLEKETNKSLKSVQQRSVVKKPTDVGLSKQTNSEWEVYLNKKKDLDEGLFRLGQEAIQKSISVAAKENDIPLDHFSRLQGAIEEVTTSSSREAKLLVGDISSSARTFHAATVDTAKGLANEIYECLQKAEARLKSAEVKRMSESALVSLRQEMETSISILFGEKKEKLEEIRDQLLSLENIWKESSYSALELQAAQEEELVELREIRDRNIELVQIGMALNTISHEFEKVTAALRHGFKRLKSWGATNPDLETLYQSMNRSFEHLDGYLSLFSPLDRRTQLEPIEITGAQIHSFLVDLFGARFVKDKIELQVSKEFKELSFQGNPSSFYPVFINLLDNSAFWLKQVHDHPRIITLDAEGNEMLIGDNGPGISPRDAENIFSLNFSRKPGGRGMGLFISRETLSNAGFQLTLEETSIGAEFRIHPRKVS